MRYVESSDRSYDSAEASEDIEAGELVALNSNMKAVLLDEQNHSIEDFRGVAEAFMRGDQIAPDENNAGTFETYLASENDTVNIGGNDDGDRIYIKTIKETNSGVTNKPSIDHNTIVGVSDTSDNDAPTSAGRIVEEGYTNDENDDGSSTTFNRSNNNFLPVGRAYRDDGDGFDKIVRVEVRKGSI